MKCLVGSLALCLHMKFLSTLSLPCSYSVLAAIGLLPSHSLAWWSGWLTVPRYDLQPASWQHQQHNTRRCAFKLTTNNTFLRIFTSQQTHTQSNLIWRQCATQQATFVTLCYNMLQNHRITFSTECNKSTKLSATKMILKR